MIFETTGAIPLIETSIPALQPKGQLILIGIVQQPAQIDVATVLSVSRKFGLQNVLTDIV